MTLLGCKVPLSGQEPCFTIINTPYLTTGIGKILCNYKLEDHNNTFSLQQILGFSTFNRVSRWESNPSVNGYTPPCLHEIGESHQEHHHSGFVSLIMVFMTLLMRPNCLLKSEIYFCRHPLACHIPHVHLLSTIHRYVDWLHTKKWNTHLLIIIVTNSPSRP